MIKDLHPIRHAYSEEAFPVLGYPVGLIRKWKAKVEPFMKSEAETDAVPSHLESLMENQPEEVKDKPEETPEAKKLRRRKERKQKEKENLD